MQRSVLFAVVLAVRNSKNMRFRAIHYRHCLFLRYFFQQLFTGVGATLASSGVGTTLQNNPLNDTQLLVSKPTPFDANQRYSCLHRDGLVSRREKSMTH
ncbi:hypothetical protein DVH24_022342 [Malus domestica]|uniref:Uncharacterized protein n=1 Tax=Malus domestica TaxID=3750 RepID=A0A498KKE3_MALDO|nr:hypothetical protein DVH24_022342 [Malus domestica]